MEAYQRDFIEFMLACGALTFGDFTTKSGRSTPYFINTGKYDSGSRLLRLGEFYAEAIIRAHGRELDNLFGPAYKGIPLAVSAAMALSSRHGREVTYTFNRKEAKDHGEGGALVGFAYPREPAPGAAPIRVVIVEDVTTAGTSVRESLPLIHAHGGARAVGLVVSVDRMERGRGEESALQEIRREHGIAATAIVTVRDILAYVEEREKAGRSAGLPADLRPRMERYLETYGARA